MLKQLYIIQLTSIYMSTFNFSKKNKQKRKKNPVMIILIALLAVYVIASLFISVGFIFYQLGNGLIPNGLGFLYFAFAAIASVVATIFFTVFMAQPILYEAKDNQFLLSMPIKTSHILGSRLLALGTVDFLSSLLFMLPAGAVYAYSAKPGFVFYVFYIISLFILPLLGLAIAALIGYAISAVTGRLRNKSLFVTLTSLAAIALFYWGYFSLTSNLVSFIEKGEEMGNSVRKILPMFYYYGKALSESDIGSFFIFALCFILPFILIFMWLSASFIKMANASKYLKKTKYKEAAIKSSGVTSALLKKEFGRFFGTPSYLLNCGISYILMIAFGVYFLVSGSEVLNTLFGSMSAEGDLLLPIIVAVMCFLSAMSLTTAPSISLEGKYIWILRSSPVRVKEIFHAKLLVNIILGVISLTAADFCILFRLNASFPDSLIIIFIPLGVLLFTAQAGLIANLFFPKFDAVNDVAAVKQSMSVIVSMLVSFALVMFIVIGYVFLVPKVLSLYIYAVIVMALMLVSNIVMYRFLTGRGVDMFNDF